MWSTRLLSTAEPSNPWALESSEIVMLVALILGPPLVLGIVIWYLVKVGLPGLGRGMREMYRRYLHVAHRLQMEYKPSLEESDWFFQWIGDFRFIWQPQHTCGSLFEGRFQHEDHVWKAAFFNYTSRTNEKSRGSVVQTILYLEVENGSSFEAFRLYPEGILRKLANLSGFQDIDFRDHMIFSELYTLKGKNEMRVRHTFSSAVIEFFETNLGLTVHSTGKGSFILFRDAQCFARETEKLADLTQAYVERLHLGLSLAGLLVKRD